MPESNSNPLIELQDVHVTIGTKSILSHIDLTVSAGRIVSLIGPNGAGKTTLVRVVLGLQKPTQGRMIRHQTLTQIGYIPQRLHIDDTLPLSVQRFLSLRNQHALTQAEPIIQALCIQTLLPMKIQTLSGGELQRVLLAKALLKKPQLLVLDEPAQGLDISGQAELYRLVQIIRDDYHCGILLVSHDLHFVMAATDTVICLHQHICCHGHPAAVAQDPAYLKLFGQNALSGLAVYQHHHDHRHTLTGDITVDDQHVR